MIMHYTITRNSCSRSCSWQNEAKNGNLYSVPDATRKRVVEVHTLADEVRIFEEGALIAAHPVLEGRHQRRVAAGHRKAQRIADPGRVLFLDQVLQACGEVCACYADVPQQGQQASAPQRPSRTNGSGCQCATFRCWCQALWRRWGR